VKRYAILLPVGDKVVCCSQIEKKTSRRIIGLLLCSLQPTGHRQHTSLSDSAPGKSDLSPTREHHRHDLYKLLIVAQTMQDHGARSSWCSAGPTTSSNASYSIVGWHTDCSPLRIGWYGVGSFTAFALELRDIDRCGPCICILRGGMHIDL